MYSSDQLKAMVEAKLRASARAGTDQTLTGYETSPPAATADIIANAQITTINSPSGDTTVQLPWEKIHQYIPVPPGVPQWGMPADTTNWAAAQYSTTGTSFDSPLALSVQQKYDLSAIPPPIYPKGGQNVQKSGLQQGSDVKNTEVYQGNARESGGENVQKVPGEGQKMSGGGGTTDSPTQQAPFMGPHRQNSWYWQ